MWSKYEKTSPRTSLTFGNKAMNRRSIFCALFAAPLLGWAKPISITAPKKVEALAMQRAFESTSICNSYLNKRHNEKHIQLCLTEIQEEMDAIRSDATGSVWYKIIKVQSDDKKGPLWNTMLFRVEFRKWYGDFEPSVNPVDLTSVTPDGWKLLKDRLCREELNIS